MVILVLFSVDVGSPGPFKNPKDGERRRRRRNTANNVVIMKNLSKLVNNIYTSAERDISDDRKLQLLNVFWGL